MTARLNNIYNSLTMISKSAMWHHFYIGLVCQNCFAHSVLVLIALSFGAFYFVKDPIKTEHYRLDFDWLVSKYLLILYFCKSLLIIVQVNRF